MKLLKIRFIDAIYIIAFTSVIIGIALGGGRSEPSAPFAECAAVLTLSGGGADIEVGDATVFGDIPVRIVSVGKRRALVKLTGRTSQRGFLAGGRKYLLLGQPITLVCCGREIYCLVEFMTYQA